MAVNVFFKVLTGFALFHFISGHGYLYDPPNRASLWRYLDDQPQNFEDNQYFCGGFDVIITKTMKHFIQIILISNVGSIWPK